MLTRRMVRGGIAAATVTALSLLGGNARISGAASVPGTRPATITVRASSSNALTPFYSATGHISDSVDGLGTIDPTGGIRVNKPDAQATVRAAFLMSASTGESDYQIPNGDVTLAGTPVNWMKSVPSDIFSFNYLADVTSIIKPIMDPAPAGIKTLAVGENNSFDIDGEALVVVFDDPQAPATNSVAYLFGAQNPQGDTFTVAFGGPVDTASPAFKLNMGLGDSYSYQAGGSQQYSVIDVNGTIPSDITAPDPHRLTTSAGGEDDQQGPDENGALMTVGGIGDGPYDPPCPMCFPTNPRSDHEYYDLRKFVATGAKTMTVNTLNPSDDDNIFFAYFESNPPIIVSTGPGTGTNCTGYTASGYCIYAATSYTDTAGNKFDTSALASNNTGAKVGTPTSVKYTCTETYTVNGQQHTKSASVTGQAGDGSIDPRSRAGILYPTGTGPVGTTATNVEAMMYPVIAHDASTGTSVNVSAPAAYINNATMTVTRGGFGMSFYGNITDTNTVTNVTTVIPNSSLACQAGRGTGQALAVYNP